jgi:hypothetical protein
MLQYAQAVVVTLALFGGSSSGASSVGSLGSTAQAASAPLASA